MASRGDFADFQNQFSSKQKGEGSRKEKNAALIWVFSKDILSGKQMFIKKIIDLVEFPSSGLTNCNLIFFFFIF